MIELEVDLEQLVRFKSRLATLLSPGVLLSRTMAIAKEAGHLLHQASVRACIEAVYDHPNFPTLSERTPSDPFQTFGGNPEERTNALLNAHILIDEGLVQRVEIDPDAEAIDPHAGREMVLDYAIPVHEGYTQWVFGRTTGEFHPGRFWFDVVEQEAGPVILSFVQQAFFQLVEELFSEAAA